MANVTLNPPRAKRWVNQSKRSPFPIPLASLIGHPPSVHEWPMYEGRLHGNGVLIDEPCHMEDLFGMGFYGKATLSRSGPSFNRNSTDELPIMSQRRYENHQSWKTMVNTENSNTECTTEPNSKDEILVVDNTDSESEPVEAMAMVKLKTNDPFPIQQKLHLTLEEAFFLSFGLGCLVVKYDGKEMNLEEMWKSFTQCDTMFLYKYISYHHFRSKGWVVRTGIRFGVHYTLYKDGPPFYHASYSVLVKPVSEDSYSTLPGATEYPNSWESLAGLNRITEHVAKELLFCYVMQPTDLTTADLMTPNCISKFQVQVTIVTIFLLTLICN